jgi:hypothetical protein
MEQVLVKEKKFEGKYVALRGLNDGTPVADGDSPKDVYDAAVRQGVKSPLILFIPAQAMVQIY